MKPLSLSRLLVLVLALAGCGDAAQTTDQVTVTLREGYLPEDDGRAPTCIEIAEVVSVPVPLDGPLDGRTVVDGATGEAVPVDVVTMSDSAAG